MAAIAPSVLPTKSEMFGWSTEHLDGAAAQWETFADQSDEAFSRYVSNISAPGGSEWTGAGHTAAYHDARDAQDTVKVRSTIYRECASIARRGSGDIQGAKRATVNAVEEIEAKGYSVAEDLTVTDAKSGGTKAEQAARKIEAQQCTEFVRWHAQGLASTAARVAGELQVEAAGLEGRQLTQGLDFKTDRIDGDLQLAGLSEERRKAVEYAEKWADGNNPAYKTYPEDCTNFVSQSLRAGGFRDKGDDSWSYHHSDGDHDVWYYRDGLVDKAKLNTESQTWDNAAASHDYFTQRSGLGKITGVVGTPGPSGYDPQAPSKAGLVPGDLIYYKTNDGVIDHVAMYVGQVNGVDVVDQHAYPRNLHDDWWPNSDSFFGGPARVEFVHMKYPGEQ